LVVAGAEWKGDAIGRIRAVAIPDATAQSLCGFVEDNVTQGSTVKTDGFQGYRSLNERGYLHDREVIGNPKRAAKAMPHIHRVFSLLDRLLLGTYQGSASDKHLQRYLDEYVFRFNRRRAKNRWQLFGRLIEECFQVPPSYATLATT
jgi:transposase-like protein